jgi:hypothetical protein
MTARDREKADKAIEILKAETSGRSPVFIQLDLADLDSVRRAAENYKRFVCASLNDCDTDRDV